MDDFINSELDIKKIVVALFVPSGKGTAVHQDRPSHGLALHLSGSKYYCFSDGTTLHVRGGDLIYMPKYSSYVVEAENSGDCYAINFDFFTDKTFEPFVYRLKNLSKLTEAFRRAAGLWSEKKQGFITGCKCELYSVLHTLQAEQSLGYVSMDKTDMIRPAVEYIHENYTSENISIAAVAEMCGITPEYFRSIFKDIFGSSPIKYINDLKITRAKELIGSGMYSVCEAAELSGYSDPSHFSREFKKAVGVAPSRYR